MKLSKCLIQASLFAILMVSLLSVFGAPTSNETEEYQTIEKHDIKRTSTTPHEPIRITDNQNFSDTVAANGWDGNGSVESPYIIENLEITAYSSGFTDCISISGTTVHFIIRNCIVKNANATSSNAGIRIRVPNGQIQHNTAFNCGNGIYINADDNIVFNNTCFWNEYGIYLLESDHNIVAENNCTDNSNTGIRVVTCENTAIRDNECILNNRGIGLSMGSTDIQIKRNNCSFSTYGIMLTESYSTTISGNYYGNNTFGAYIFQSSDGNTVENNTFYYSITYNVYLEGSVVLNNTIQWNTFYYDLLDEPIRDNDTYAWIVYNYYLHYNDTDNDNNGIWDLAFEIRDYNYDWYPLVYEPRVPCWNHVAPSLDVEYGDGLRVDFNATSSSPIREYWLNDSTWFNIDTEGVLTNSTPLPVDVYPLRVGVTNLYNFTANMTILVNVEDTTPPEWLSAQTNHEFVQGDEIVINVTAWDRSGIASWSLTDNPYFWFNANVSQQTSRCRIGSDVIPPADVYELELTAFDPYDNSRSVNLTITIIEHTITTTTSTASTTPPTSTTSTTTTATMTVTSPSITSSSSVTTTSSTEPTLVTTSTSETESTTSPADAGSLVLILALIGGGLVVVVVIVIILKKR